MTDTQTPGTATELDTLGLVAVIDRLHRTGAADIPKIEFLHALTKFRDQLGETVHVLAQLSVSIDEYLTCDPNDSDIAGEGEDLALEQRFWLSTARDHATDAIEMLSVLRPYFVRPTPPQPTDTPPSEETT